MSIQVTDEWESWIRHNLLRGCLFEQLLTHMIDAGISRFDAISAIQNSQNEASNLTGNNSFVYENSRIPFVSRVQCVDRIVNIRFRIEKPSIVVFDDLLSLNECDELIQLSRVKLMRSSVINPIDGKEKFIDERSSSGTYFNVFEDTFIERLDRRVAALMNSPIENGEGFQILNYKVGGEYRSHYDYFPPQDVGSNLHLERAGQRISTLIIYLNDVKEGGETRFPLVGISVYPKKGSALYFEYCNSFGQVDELSLHAGMPVLCGEKWIATKWMRLRHYE